MPTATPSLPGWRKRTRDGHLVVCGDNPLAHRLVEELTTRFGEDVTAILPSRRRNHGPQIAALPGVWVVEADELDGDAFQAARIETARALALVDQDDVGNIHAALRAQELNAGLRLVIRIFQNNLRYRIRTLFADCAVLSDAALSAPSFVAAALGEQAPSHVRLPGHTLYVAPRADVPAERVICGLADTTGDDPRLLPPDQDSADLVLGIAAGAAHDPLRRRSSAVARARRSPGLLRPALRGLVNRKLRVALLALLGLLVASTAVFATIGGYGWSDAIYLTLLDAAGAANAEPRLNAAAKAAQIVVTVVGILLIPVITAAVVDAVVEMRLARTLGRLGRPAHDHVVVVGLGNVGSRVVAQLHDLGVPVVCVERNDGATGVALARRLGLPIVFGDATVDDTLRDAYIGACRALVVVTSDDVANLEVALHGRELLEDLPVVLRLFDDDFARRLQHNFGITVSRSVSFLAAPAFAAAMVERQVIGTIPVGRQVLLIADVPVSPGSDLDRRTVRDVHLPGEAWVIALRRGPATDFDWTPDQEYVLSDEDRLVILATRAGLGAVLARSISTGASA